MNRDEYERHIAGNLCWRCHEATRRSHKQQRRCPECLSKWSFNHRRLEWDLMKAFAYGVSAHRAAEVIGCSYPAAHGTFMICRRSLYPFVQSERQAVLDELQETVHGQADRLIPSRGTPSFADNAGGLAIIEWGGRVTVAHELAHVEAVAAIRSRRKWSGLIIDGDTLAILKDLTQSPGHRARRKRIGMTRAEAFWRSAVTAIRHQARGVAAEHLALYLAESEHRFNHGSGDLLEVLYSTVPKREPR